MAKYELSIFDPNTLLPHRAGIAGLRWRCLCLSLKDAPLSWTGNGGCGEVVLGGERSRCHQMAIEIIPIKSLKMAISMFPRSI